MKYLGLSPNAKRKDGDPITILNDQWIEIDDKEIRVFRWINFIEDKLACGQAIHSGKLKVSVEELPYALSSYSVVLSEDKFNMLFSISNDKYEYD